MAETVSFSEIVTRTLHPDWIEENVLLHQAFLLKENETYISVNRPAVSSYDDDVSDFIMKHPEFSSDNKYKRALLSVGDVCNINITLEGIDAIVQVEIEPCDAHYKSHAGIFTRIENKNVKKGQLFETRTKENISADSILLEVRMNLLDIATVEECTLPKAESAKE